jgi:hypothetical protein
MDPVMSDRNPLLALAIGLLALAVLVGAFAIGHGIRDRGHNDVITVTGSTKKRVTADFVIWNVSVSAQEPSADTAATMLAGWTKRVRAFFADEQVGADELTVQPIATEAIDAEDTGEGGTGILGYKLTRTFQIRSSRVADIRKVAERTSKLLRANVPLEAEPPQYVYTKLPDLRPALLAEAARDAKRRAQSLLDATGGHLGGLRGVDVGVFQVTSPNSTEVSDYGEYDTSTVKKDVTAVVNVTFARRS